MTEPLGATIRFLKDFNFTPDENRMWTRKYRAGWQGLVRKQCADKAIEAGAAEIVKPARPRRRKSAA